MIARTFGKLGLWALVVALLMAGLTPASAAPSQSPASATMGVNGAQVYGGPGLGFWRLGRLRAGATVPLIGKNADASFWLVRAPFGEGWISNDAVASAITEGVPEVEVGLFAAIPSGNVTVRTNPGVDAPRLGVISQGAQFFVLGQNSDGSWLEIQTGFGKGWVARALTTLADGSVNIPGGGGSEGEGESADGGSDGGEMGESTGAMAEVIASFLNIRSGPGNYFTTLAVASKGDKFPILGKTRDGFWLLVETGAGDGWINIRFVKTTDFFGNAPIITRDVYLVEAVVAGTTRTSVNVRTGPSPDFDIVGTLSGAGVEVAILGQSKDKAWWYVSTSVGPGWVNKGVIQVLGGTELIPVIQ
ncbi:MAG: hypothetical protein OHK0023_07480 [Anaerolineae bacterium]